MENLHLVHEIQEIIESEVSPKPTERALTKAQIIYDEVVKPVMDGLHASGMKEITALRAEVSTAKELLRNVKAWRDSDGNEAFPHELRKDIDAFFGTFSS